MKSKKIVAFLLSLLMGLSVMTSCGSKEGSSSNSADAGSSDSFFDDDSSSDAEPDESTTDVTESGTQGDQTGSSKTDGQSGTANNNTSQSGGGTQSNNGGGTGATAPNITPSACTLKMACIDTDDEKMIANAFAKAFMKKYPNVKVQVTPINGDYQSKILTQAVSKTLPDVLFCFDTQTRVFAKNGVFQSIDSEIAKFGGFNKNDYVGNILDFGKGADGKMYMIPREYSHLVTAVNLSIIEATLGMNKADFMKKYANWTMDQFIDLTKKLTQKDGAGRVVQYGADINFNWEPVWTSFALGYGGTVVNGSKAAFNNTNTIKGFTVMMDLVKNGYACNNLSQNASDVYPFSKGAAAFLFMSRPSLPSLHKEMTALKMEYDFLPFPKTPTKAVVGMGTTGYGVGTSTKNKYEAALLAYFIATEDGQKAYISTGAGVPIIQSLSNSNTWKNYPVTGKNSSAFISNPSYDRECEFSFNYNLSKISGFTSNFNDSMLKYLAAESSMADTLKSLDSLLN